MSKRPKLSTAPPALIDLDVLSEFDFDSILAEDWPTFDTSGFLNNRMELVSTDNHSSHSSHPNWQNCQIEPVWGNGAWSYPTSYPPPIQPPSAPSYPPLHSPNYYTENSQFAKVVPYVAKPFEFTLSKASQDWDSRKSEEEEANDTLDELMQYQGLEAVKQQFLEIKAKVDCCLEQGRDLKSERFNIIFQGNPGTGKTTVARLYAEFLCSLGLLESEYVKETTGIKIATSGPAKIKQKIKKILNDHDGGVLFVDEAYQLTASYVDSAGRSALDIILTAMENNIGKLVVIFVGYKDEMESFFEHNPGLYSRIPYIMNFTDFTDGELWKILRDTISKEYKGRMQVEGGMDGLYMRIAIRRLAQTRGSRNFGNARAVQNLFAKISQRQSQRLIKENGMGLEPNYFLFTKEDLIGPEPAMAAQKSKAWTRLQELIGLKQVKDSVEDLIGILDHNYRRELTERPPLTFSLNQLFVGNPGTGKTTVAKLYGQILADLGYLSKGDVVFKNPADFIGDCLGKSEANTKKIMEATVGKVLVIDEAYMLDSGDADRDQDRYKTGVIDTMVSMIQGVPGEDRCIVLIGYENQMKNMFRNVNPGLSRRFPIEQPFRFENFDLPQLEQILRLKMKEQELECTDDAMKVACEVLERSLMRPNFSNAGEVDSLLSRAKMKMNTRCKKRRLSMLPPGYMEVDMMEAADFDPNFSKESQVDCRKLMEGLVHSTIIDTFTRYQEQYSRARSLGMNPRRHVPTRFIFKGPSGTGKTTAAKKMGELFHGMGFLATPEVVECSAADLLGQYVGQTVPKTRKKLQESIGRVLFIDEARRLINGQYATEAVDELVQFLSQNENEGKLVVVLAGLSADIERLLSHRPSIGSHFPDEIIFDHLSPEDCIELLAKELEIDGFASEAEFFTNVNSVNYNKVKRLFGIIKDTYHWSNARDVRNLSKKIIQKFLQSPEYSDMIQFQLRILPAGLIITCMEETIAQRKRRSSAMPQIGIDSYQNLLNAQLASPPPSSGSGTCTPEAGNTRCATNHHISIETRSQGRSDSPVSRAEAMHTRIKEAQVRGTMPRDLGDEDIREEDVSEEVWLELQREKAAENAKCNRRDKDIKRLQRDLQEAIERGDASKITFLQNQLLAFQQEIQSEERVQEALQKMGRCVAGYVWNRVGGGYRCAGGSHFVGDGDVQSKLAK
ncbi:P-loop containing nucleoside triphosphate hydrolase protein [Rostrohypoxylon terebratum]|nr:P-loop containing nucleoside triphosphate hydrolase protein [Rostrohypoxylon terebratum]